MITINSDNKLAAAGFMITINSDNKLAAAGFMITITSDNKLAAACGHGRVLAASGNVFGVKDY